MLKMPFHGSNVLKHARNMLIHGSNMLNMLATCHFIVAMC